MATAALITWLLTAACGLGMVSIWIIEHDGDGPVSRLPKTVLGVHALLALTGLALWVSIEPPAPPERRLPIALVIVHGLFAVTTLMLTLLTALEIAGS
jgi:hypothetical protein